MIALRRATEAAGGEVVAVSHRVGTHMFAPVPPDGETETDGAPDKQEIDERGEPDDYKDLPDGTKENPIKLGKVK